MKHQTRTMLAYTALVVAAMIGLYLNSHQATENLKNSQLSACGRSNVFREEVNKRGVILKHFLVTAAEAREDGAIVQRDQGAIAEARINELAASRWRIDASRVHPVDLVVCEDVIK